MHFDPQARPGCFSVCGGRRCDVTGVALERWPTTGNTGENFVFLGASRRQPRSSPSGGSAPPLPPLANLVTVTDRFIAGGPRRVRQENESFWAFLLGWVGSLFRVDRKL